LMGGFLFFRYLQNERSDLLDFRAVGSKWQIVHDWIRDRVISRPNRASGGGADVECVIHFLRRGSPASGA
jgi:hypothetical protein